MLRAQFKFSAIRCVLILSATLLEGPAFGQADSVSSRRPIPTNPPPALGTNPLNQVTLSRTLDMPVVGNYWSWDDKCQFAYPNNTGGVLMVTTTAPNFGSSQVFIRPNAMTPWRLGAINNRGTAQAYVPPGWWSCAVNIDSPGGVFWVTVFKANAPETEYASRIQLWDQIPEGEICASTNGDGDCIQTHLIVRRRYLDGRVPSELRFVFDGSSYRPL